MQDLQFDNYPDIVTPEDIQKMLRLGRNSVYNLLKQGKIKSLRVGKKYLIPKTSVMNFLQTAG